MSKATMLALAALAALAAGLAAGASESDHGGSAPATKRTAVMAAQWTYRPRDLRELIRKSPVAVVATVTGVRPGSPLPEARDAVRTPTQRIELAVERGLLGRTPSRLELFKTGSHTQWIEGDPPYRTGERYLLFLRPQRGGRGAWIPVGPEGRLRIEGQRLRPLVGGAVARELARRPVGAIERALGRDQKGSG